MVRKPERRGGPIYSDWRDRPEGQWAVDLPVGTILEEERRFEIHDNSHSNWWRVVFSVMRVVDGPLTGEQVEVFMQDGQAYDPPLASSVPTWLDALPGGMSLEPFCAFDICSQIGQPTAKVIEAVVEAWNQHWTPFRGTTHRCDEACVPDILRRYGP